MLHESFLSIPFAHRGLWDADRPENTMAAAQAAVDSGFGIEVDLQLSKDDQAMVFHDDTVDRLTSEIGWVQSYTAEELGQMSILESDQTIRALPELLKIVDGRVPLLLELKDPTARPGGILGPLETRVMRDLSTYVGPVAVMSFHPGVVKNLARMAPAVPRGLVGQQFDPEEVGQETADALNDYASFEDSGCCFISHNWRDLGMPAVARLKEQGVPILCWTTRAPVEGIFAKKIADNVTFEGYLPT